MPDQINNPDQLEPDDAPEAVRINTLDYFRTVETRNTYSNEARIADSFDTLKKDNGFTNEKENVISIEDEEVKVSEKYAKNNCIKIKDKWYRFHPTENKKIKYINNAGENCFGGYVLLSETEIVKGIDGDNLVKDNCIELWDGGFVNKKSYGIVKTIDDRIGLKGHNVIKYNNFYYTYDNENIVELKRYEKKLGNNSVKIYEHKDNCSFIYNNTRLSGFYVKNKDVVRCNKTGYDFFIKDCYNIKLYNQSSVYINKEIAAKVDIRPVLLEIANIDGEIQYYHKLAIDPAKDNLLSWSSKLKVFVIKGTRAVLNKKKAALMAKYESKRKTNKFKSSAIGVDNLEINNLDYISDETIAKNVFVINGEINGGQTYNSLEEIFKRPIYSQTLSKVGGIDYTFGIEHETCVGIVPDYKINPFGISKIGDGSTRIVGERNHPCNVLHYEYVTGVLHGDIGINRVYKYLPEVGSHTLFNNSCSTHFHIGGQTTDKGFRSTMTPSFNRKFSALAIKLGIQIEDSLSSILPDHRNPKTNEYCSSIKHFDVFKTETKKDINNLIANYVFNSPELNSDFNSLSSLGKWNSGRYKWLNLTNCNSKNGRHRLNSFKTIEFRIFPATNDPEKIHFWLLICLGFVWFVENRPNLIRKGNVTLTSMMKETYEGKKIYDFIKSKM